MKAVTVVSKLLEADLDWEPDPSDPDDHMPEIGFDWTTLDWFTGEYLHEALADIGITGHEMTTGRYYLEQKTLAQIIYDCQQFQHSNNFSDTGQEFYYARNSRLSSGVLKQELKKEALKFGPFQLHASEMGVISHER